jgi:hypothetical protein
MTTWTPERIEQLRALHAQGLSRRATAEIMGLTANQVSGKCDRLGLTASGVPYVKSPVPRARRAGVSRAQATAHSQARTSSPKRLAPLPLPIVSAPPVGGKGVLDIRSGECRYPIGEDASVIGTQIFCAQPAIGSWCESHFRVVRRSD